MMITKENLYDAVYENENARLLILDVVNNSNIKIFFGKGAEITLAMALDIWYKVNDERSRRRLNRTLPRVRQRYKLVLPDSEKYISEAV